jgi:hypothetical protein
MSYRDSIDGFLRRVGICVENRPPSDNEAPPDESGRWDIDWENPNDPLRRAILGLGPKRPYGK